MSDMQLDPSQVKKSQNISSSFQTKREKNEKKEKKERIHLARVFSFYVLSDGTERRLYGLGSMDTITDWHLSSSFLEGAYDQYSRVTLETRQKKMADFCDPAKGIPDGALLMTIYEEKANGSLREIRLRMYHIKEYDSKEDEDI